MIAKKSGILVLLWMLWSLLAGCGTNQTYDELADEYSITGDRTKLDRREATLEKAEAYFQNKAACLQAEKYTWICPRMHGSSRVRRKPKTMSIDATIREYRNQMADGCGCADEMQTREFLRELGRQLGN